MGLLAFLPEREVTIKPVIDTCLHNGNIERRAQRVLVLALNKEESCLQPDASSRP